MLRLSLVITLLTLVGCASAQNIADPAAPSPELAGKPSPVATIKEMYMDYLNGQNLGKTKSPQLLVLSKSFSELIAKNGGWGAGGNPFLDAQEFEPNLKHEDAKLTVTPGPNPNLVVVQLDVFPKASKKSAAGDYYQRKLIYKTVFEGGRWTVDDIISEDKDSKHESYRDWLEKEIEQRT